MKYALFNPEISVLVKLFMADDAPGTFSSTMNRLLLGGPVLL